MPTTIQDLYVQKGQSVWLQGYDRSKMVNGQLKQMIQSGVRGMVFDHSSPLSLLQNSTAYDQQIKLHHVLDEEPLELFKKLLLDDVRTAADLFAPIYHVTMGIDGYVSIPVDPRYSYDSEKLVSETLSLFKSIRRPNVVFQIPATKEGFLAVYELILAGISVHVRHAFSFEQLREAFSVYVEALEQVVSTGVLARTITCFLSVAYEQMCRAFSGYASDDPSRAKILNGFNGDVGLYACNHIYHESAQFFSTDRFASLQEKGCHRQRLIWEFADRPFNNKRVSNEIAAFIAKHTISALEFYAIERFIDEQKISSGLMETSVDESPDLSSVFSSADIDRNTIFTKMQYEAISHDQSLFTELLRVLKYKKKC